MEQDMTHNGEISLSRRTIVRVLAATTLFLLSVSIAGQLAKYALGQQVYRFNRLFYVDFEGNIPTFFSSILLILASSLLWFITVLKKSSQDPYRRHWAILAFIVLFMAVDEAVGLHELLDKVRWVPGHRKGGLFHYGWVLFGMAMVIAVAFSYLRFFFALPARTRMQFFTAAAVFVSGAIGVEVLAGNYSASHGGEESLQFSMFATVEEGLEMAGVIVLINALLNYVIDHHEVRLRFDHFK
ncbi:MAG TPA: hypothetical protein VN666_02380 [Nitrospira sp.]|nr:hypothetical protein [Nitrospira sp.]